MLVVGCGGSQLEGLFEFIYLDFVVKLDCQLARVRGVEYHAV